MLVVGPVVVYSLAASQNWFDNSILGVRIGEVLARGSNTSVNAVFHIVR